MHRDSFDYEIRKSEERFFALKQAQKDLDPRDGRGRTVEILSHGGARAVGNWMETDHGTVSLYRDDDGAVVRQKILIDDVAFVNVVDPTGPMTDETPDALVAPSRIYREFRIMVVESLVARFGASRVAEAMDAGFDGVIPAERLAVKASIIDPEDIHPSKRDRIYGMAYDALVKTLRLAPGGKFDELPVFSTEHGGPVYGDIPADVGNAEMTEVLFGPGADARAMPTLSSGVSTNHATFRDMAQGTDAEKRAAVAVALRRVLKEVAVSRPYPPRGMLKAQIDADVRGLFEL